MGGMNGEDIETKQVLLSMEELRLEVSVNIDSGGRPMLSFLNIQRKKLGETLLTILKEKSSNILQESKMMLTGFILIVQTLIVCKYLNLKKGEGK